MEEGLVWEVCAHYGMYIVCLVRPEVNDRKIIKYTDKTFGFSQIKDAEKLAAALNERDGIKRI